MNDVLATNLARFMAAQGHTQSSLAKRSGVAQRTIGNYLQPNAREVGSRGKPGSAKLTELAMIAAALQVATWQLLVPEIDPQHLPELRQPGDVGEAELLRLYRTMDKDTRPALLARAKSLQEIDAGGSDGPPSKQRAA